MKAILLDEAKKWLEENCENQYTRMAVFGIMQSMPTVDYQKTPNEPLTLEELTLMTEPTPVWWDWVQGWVLARKGMIMSWNGRYHNSGELRGDFYRRPPEGDEKSERM